MMTLDARAFTWTGLNGCAEASELNFPIGETMLRVVSPRTGRAVTFSYVDVLLDRVADEVIGWQYANSMEGLTITVYND